MPRSPTRGPHPPRSTRALPRSRGRRALRSWWATTSRASTLRLRPTLASTRRARPLPARSNRPVRWTSSRFRSSIPRPTTPCLRLAIPPRLAPRRRAPRRLSTRTSSTSSGRALTPRAAPIPISRVPRGRRSSLPMPWAASTSSARCPRRLALRA